MFSRLTKYACGVFGLLLLVLLVTGLSSAQSADQLTVNVHFEIVNEQRVPAVSVGDEVTIVVKVTNDGLDDVAGRNVTLMIGTPEEPSKEFVGSTVVDIPAGESKEFTFEWEPKVRTEKDHEYKIT